MGVVDKIKGVLMGNKADITGQVGAVPPPDAPRETAAPLAPDTIAVQQANARANEKVLPPFNPPQRPIAQTLPTPAPQPAPKPSAQLSTADLIADVFGESELPSGIEPDRETVDQLVDVFPTAEALPPLTDEDRARMPAASNTDTPAKGLLPNLVPAHEPDKFEGISRGGFSDVGEAQYFPLSGDELREVILSLFTDLTKRIDNDLRFSMALTYPRVRARVLIEVEGMADDDNAGFVIERLFVPKIGDPGSTPVEIARAKADKVVFVVQAVKQEVAPDGQSDTPPDQFRDDLGLPKPRKQIVQFAGRESFVDVMVGSGAVTR